MARQLLCWLAALVLVWPLLLAGVAAQNNARPRQWWWRVPDTQARIGLTSEQVRTLDRIYRDSLAGRRLLRKRLDVLERRFTRLLRDPGYQTAGIDSLVDDLTDARRRSSVARTMMLVRMLEVLRPAQRERLAQIDSDAVYTLSNTAW